MMSKYCPECGTALEDDTPTAAAVETVSDNEVEIARINARRDVDVARLSTGAAEHIAEADQATDTARAEGEAEGMREVIDAATGDGDGQAGGDGPGELEPVIVTADASESDGPPEATPPPPEHAEPNKEPAGSGWWAGYR